MFITVKHRGNFNNTERFFRLVRQFKVERILRKYGEAGVHALAAATPTRTGLTAASWQYEIQHGGGASSIVWTNTNENKGVNIAIILQYGHGTGTGGYVAGIDYINPAIQPVFVQLAEEAWREVTQ